MSAQPGLRDHPSTGPRANPCPRGHQMHLQHVEVPPRRVICRGGIGGAALGVSYNQWVCDTCGHRGIPLAVSR
jgi:hypothetical protein